jgi:hypothetical protein
MELLLAVKFAEWVKPIVSAVAGLSVVALRAGGSLTAMGATLAGLTAPAWLLALIGAGGLAALYQTVKPQPLNPGEDEFARQKKYGLASKDENKGVRAAAHAIRRKIAAPEDDASVPARKGMATPISYGGGFDAASFRKEDAAERAILKGTFEGTRQGVLAAFKEFVESRRQGYGNAGITDAAYHPDGGYGEKSEGGVGAAAGGRRHIRPGMHHRDGASNRSEPSEAAAARSLKDFAAGGSKAGSLTELIEEEARRAGIDPRIMHGIRAGESLHTSHYDVKNDALESSYGPFQLNRRRGLGVDFEKETGLDVRNPATIAAQARWVANYIRKHRGTNGQWMGYHGPRNADPRWGESGYHPSKEQATKSGEQHPPKSASSGMIGLRAAARATSGGMNDWIEQQRGAHPDRGAPSQAFHMQKGGPVVGQHPYLVGEKGPELFVPHQSGEVIPNNQSFYARAASAIREWRNDYLIRQMNKAASGTKFNPLNGKPFDYNSLDESDWRVSNEIRGLRTRGEGVFKDLENSVIGVRGYRKNNFDPKTGQKIDPGSIRPEEDEHRKGSSWKPSSWKGPRWDAHLQDSVGAAARAMASASSMFGQPHRKSNATNINLMASARQAELVHTPQKVVGDASLRIDLHGFPKGTKTKAEINGLFKTLTMYRGLAAPMAGQES